MAVVWYVRAPLTCRRDLDPRGLAKRWSVVSQLIQPRADGHAGGALRGAWHQALRARLETEVLPLAGAPPGVAQLGAHGGDRARPKLKGGWTGAAPRAVSTRSRERQWSTGNRRDKRQADLRLNMS